MNFKKSEDGTIEAMKEETTGEIPMRVANGYKEFRFWRFACSNYPDCKTTKPITTGIACLRRDAGVS
jgi:DNA topoisomerase-1